MTAITSTPLTEAIIADLINLASGSCWYDEEDFAVDDYCGGNFDDAFEGGLTSGKVTLARDILTRLGITY